MNPSQTDVMFGRPSIVRSVYLDCGGVGVEVLDGDKSPFRSYLISKQLIIHRE